MVPLFVKELMYKSAFVAKAYASAKGRYMHLMHRKDRLLLRKLGGEAFERVYAIMSKQGYPYFANYGTLLGVVRENGYVKNDDDIDLSVPANTISAGDLVSAFQKEDGFAFVTGYEWRGMVTEVTMSYRGLPIDFFFQYIEDGVNYSHWYDPVDGKWTDANGGRFAFRRPIPVARNVRPVNFMGGVVPVPENADEILTSAYGDWRTPVDKNLRTDYEAVRPPKVLLAARGHMLMHIEEISSHRKDGD